MSRWGDLIKTGSFIGGEVVRDFEERLAAYVSSSFAVGCGNGTDAIMLALRALGLQTGDEVITAANTFFATVEAIEHAGGEPVLVDVDPLTATIDPQAVEAAITPRTRFVVPVHLYGQPADMNEILRLARKYDLLVVEDNAQAIGARFGGRRTGSLGDAAAFSFYPGKNLGATGDGGAVTTNNAEVAATVRMLADHGQLAKYDHVAVGHNSRLDAVHAAALTVKLRYLDGWNARRNYVADRYRTLIEASDVVHPVVGDNRTHVYHLYVAQVTDRDGLRTGLANRGIATGLHYPVPIHLTPPFAGLGAEGEFPIAERWAREGISLPMFPELSDDQIQYVAGTLNDLLEARVVLSHGIA